MKETATQRMLRLYLEKNPGPHSPLMQAAITGESDAFIARKVVSELGDEFSVADIRSAIVGDPEPAKMTCPCCGSTDTTRAKTARISTICWDCKALFKETPGGTVQIDECTCGRHDNGKTVKHEEVTEI